MQRCPRRQNDRPGAQRKARPVQLSDGVIDPVPLVELVIAEL